MLTRIPFLCYGSHMSTERKPFPIRLNDEELQMLDDIRREEPDLPVRSEMVRRLIERGHAKVPRKGRK